MKTVGIIIPSADNSFFAGLADQLEKNLREISFTAVMISCGNDAEAEKNAYIVLKEAGVRGIISVSGLSVFPNDLLPEDIPLVWVDRVPESDREIPWVANDDRDAMKKATDYLIEKGCRNILLMPGYIAQQKESPRVEGYRQSVESHGMEYRKDYVLNRNGIGTSEEETEQLVQECLGRGYKVDAIITSSDRAAFGAMRALEKVGKYVPEDIRLISFDNSPYTAMAEPGITALDRRPDLLAKEAVTVLSDLMEGKAVREDHVVPVTLAERTSTR